MRLWAAALAAALLAGPAAAQAPWGGGTTQTIQPSPGTNASSEQCLAQGLAGQCNSCVCCCYAGSSAFVTYRPTEACACVRDFDGGEIKLAAVLAVIVVVPTLLASCYLGGQLWISPYKPRSEDADSEEHSPADAPPSRPASPPRPSFARRRTVELTARTA